MRHAVLSAEPEVAHEAQLLGELTVVRHDGSPLEGVQELRSVEAEDLAGAGRPDLQATSLHAERVAGVEQEGQAVTIRDLGQGIDVARLAPQVHRQDPARPVADE